MTERAAILAKRAMVLLLRGYKWALSPMFLPSCRYVPTCSEYAVEAVERYGVVKGSWMTLARLLRCHPFVKGGYDPVDRTSRRHSVEKAEHVAGHRFGGAATRLM